mmetsp:Transcript_42306/g.63988  ORF Transcript_42306/g.63988 Transcript_42306/m.63988 type:complete len:807 (+) Transcript_42306:68-2488(+)
MAAVHVLKITFEGEVRRMKLEKAFETYEEVLETIHKAWPEVTDFVAKYADADGDLCTLCQATFADFQAHGELKGDITLYRVELQTASATAAPTAMACDASAPAMVQPAMDFNWSMPGFDGMDQEAFNEMLHQSMQMFKGAFKGHCGGKFGKGGFGWGDWHHGKGHHCKGHGKHKGKGFGKCKGMMMDNSDWWLGKPKVLFFFLRQMHASGSLSEESLASMLLHLLPVFTSQLVEKPDFFEYRLYSKPEAMNDLLELFQAYARTVPALNNLVPSLTNAATAPASDWNSTATPAILNVLLRTQELPFAEKAACIRQLAALALPILEKHFKKWDAAWPAWPDMPSEHAGVFCDGCELPLSGPRYICETIENFDLCAKCYLQKSTVCDGQCAEHSFTCKPLDFYSCMMAKGWCKGKGKGKSCGKRKGWWNDDEENNQVDEEEPSAKHWKGGKCGKGFGKGHCFWKGGFAGTDAGNGHQTCRPRFLLRALIELKHNNLLTPQAFSGLIVHFAPGFLEHVDWHIDAVNDIAAQHWEVVKAFFEVLSTLASQTSEMEECGLVLQEALSGSSTVAAAISSLLTSLTKLPFEAQIAFMEQFFALGQNQLEQFLTAVSAFHPPWGQSMVHSNVECDGCNAKPLVGLRFTDQQRENFDLCSKCYSSKNTVAGGESAGHTFQCTLFDWSDSSTEDKSEESEDGWVHIDNDHHHFHGHGKGFDWEGKGCKGFWGAKGFGKDWMNGGGKDCMKGFGKDWMNGGGKDCMKGFGKDWMKGGGKDCMKGFGKDWMKGGGEDWMKGFGKDMKGCSKGWHFGWEW